MSNEVWKTVTLEGFLTEDNSKYEVSNLGNIRSKNYRNTGEVKLLQPFIEKKTGYLKVCLYYKGKKRIVPLHRILFFAFNPDVDINAEIHFKDKNKLNVNLENLVAEVRELN